MNRRIKVLIDATEITSERQHASIPIYIMRFLSCVAKEDRQYFYLLISPKEKHFFLDKYPGFPLVEFNTEGFKNYYIQNLMSVFNKRKLNSIIETNNIDVFFVPTDIQTHTMFNVKCKKVCVVHDLKGLKKPSLNISDAFHSHCLSKIYHNAICSSDKIIAISKFTKQDIMCYFPEICSERIEVIYNSVDLPKNERRPKGFNSENYILYVNTLHAYKNILTLIKAYGRICSKTTHDLLIVGKPTQYWDDVIVPYMKANNFYNRVVNLFDLEDVELKFLYKNANIFITTSLREGFGYTPIEAAICKCPVIATIQEAIPDVTEGLLNYYYPAIDDEYLSNQILHLINNPTSKERLTQISDYYLMKYSTDNQYSAIMDLFYNLC